MLFCPLFLRITENIAGFMGAQTQTDSSHTFKTLQQLQKIVL